ncbi:MAG: N-acetyltransferase family protein [Reyranellaceae bacterium]
MIGIRRAAPPDAFAIARVHVETWRATYPTLLPHDYLAKRLSVDTRAIYWQRTLQADQANEAVFVAEEAGEVIGFASIGRARKAPRDTVDAARPSRHWGEVFTLYVLPDHQERGAGRMLLANGFAELLERGFDAALLWVVAGNPSRFFYEAMGGRAAGSDVEKFAGASIEEICYAWPELAAAMTRLAAQTHRRRAPS